ncbi:hypothetical protein [Limnohabitans sp.]|uniref:hypothetical protein n=1 Tax=Limnohabitans sp. TaxID=1907725 RepID=UPI00286F0808|nr:hypothetical protein [Limnohabitans sp.]
MKCLLSVLFLTFAFNLCGLAHAQQNLSVAAQLASIDAARMLNESDPAVVRMRSALDDAKLVCRVDSLVTGDQVAAIRKALAAKNVTVTNIELVEMIPQMVGNSKFRGKCEQYIAMYAALRDKGFSHPKATNAVRGVLNGL